jgi:Xaa-Pro aminopeptidase
MIDESIYKKRRELFLKRMKPQSAALLLSAPQKIRSNDTEYPYRQDSDFYYLCGFKEDNAALLLIKKKKSTQEVLFVQKKEPHMELWTGKRLGEEGAKERFDMDKIHTSDRLRERLKKYFTDIKRVYIDLFGEEKKLDEVRELLTSMQQGRGVGITPKELLHVREISQAMRSIKSREELELIKTALSITKEAHHKVMKMPKAGVFEYQLQAEFEYEFKKNGAYSDAYTTIIAGGDNGNTLHYIENSQRLKEGELILIDAGCEYEMYASDITRTIPVSGRFTQEQKEIYELVLKSELKVIDAIKEGVLRSDLQMMAREILCEGMVELGILEGEVKELLKENRDRKYFPHGIGHWMGLDVHDPCPYKDEKGKEIPLQAGMVMTIEPGLYFPLDDESLPQKYRGIAVRIEDNILVIQDGSQNLSFDIAKSVEEIEALNCAHNSIQ